VSRTAPRPLTYALAGLTDSLSPASTLARVHEVWASTVGAAIAAEATPTGEHEGVLIITCAAAVWAQELDLMAGELIVELNRALGSERIRELRCRTG
jgi:predicted nucleic acid-binding Zn ribbon protein